MKTLRLLAVFFLGATTLFLVGASTTTLDSIIVGGFKMGTGAGSGKVLTSDADGDATWETASSGGGAVTKYNANQFSTNQTANQLDIRNGAVVTNIFVWSVSSPGITITSPSGQVAPSEMLSMASGGAFLMIATGTNNGVAQIDSQGGLTLGDGTTPVAGKGNLMVMGDEFIKGDIYETNRIIFGSQADVGLLRGGSAHVLFQGPDGAVDGAMMQNLRAGSFNVTNSGSVKDLIIGGVDPVANAIFSTNRLQVDSTTAGISNVFHVGTDGKIWSDRAHTFQDVVTNNGTIWLAGGASISSSAGILQLNSGAASNLRLQIGGSTKWTVQESSNELKPANDNLTDIGSGALRVRNYYVGTGITNGSAALQSGISLPASATITIYTNLAFPSAVHSFAAIAGVYGEVTSSLVASGSAVGLTTDTAANVTSISLTSGDWEVSGNINFAGSTATYTGGRGGITTTSATVPTDGTEVYSGVQFTAVSVTDGITLSPKQINVNSTTTVYLVARATFSAGSVGAFGSIKARRMR